MGFLTFFTIIFLLFLIDCTIRKDKKIDRFFMTGLAFCSLLIFSAMRGTGEGDYFNYLSFARVINNFSYVTNRHFPVEIGFRFIAFMVNYLSLSRQIVIASMNVLSVIPIMYLTYKHSNLPFLSLLVFLPIFMQFDMQTARTASAISLGALAFHFLLEKRKIAFFICLLLSFSFHKSAVILLILYFLMYVNLSRMTKLFTVLISFMLSIRSGLFINLLTNLFSKVGLSSIGQKIYRYTYGDTFSYSMKLFDPRIIIAVLLFITTLMYFDDKKIIRRSFEDYVLKSIFLSVIMLLLFRQSTAISFRLSSFFAISQIFYIPMVYEKIRKFDRAGAFFIVSGVFLYMIPYAMFLAFIKSPAYDFFYTNPKALILL